MKMLANKEGIIKFSKLKSTCQFRCPVYSCFKNWSNQQQLKNHISRQHKELDEAGVDIASNGKIKWPDSLLDNVLRVCAWQKKFVMNQIVKKQAEKRYKEQESQPTKNGI